MHTAHTAPTSHTLAKHFNPALAAAFVCVRVQIELDNSFHVCDVFNEHTNTHPSGPNRWTAKLSDHNIHPNHPNAAEKKTAQRLNTDFIL